MKKQRSKVEVELLGEYLRDRKSSHEEEQSGLDRVWKDLRSEGDQVARDFRPMSGELSRWRLIWVSAAAALVVAGVLLGVFLRSESPAVVENVDGTLERVTENGAQAIRAGDNLAFGEVVRSGSTTNAVLTLHDGSKIEMRSTSALALENAIDGVRIRLDGGGIFVRAAKQNKRHLYVQTRDMTVSVVGTVFLVNTEEAGSRVAVIEGEVQVQHGEHGEKSSRLLPGEQVTTNPLMAEHPVVEQLAWSHSAEPYLAPLHQPKRLEFEVGVLRPVSRSGQFIARLRCKGIDGEFRPVVGRNVLPVPLGRCVSDASDLQMILATAYDIEDTRITGLPSRTEQPVFQLDAKAEDPARATREELRQMLQNFVVDKLRLKVHRETKEMDGYVLTIGKNGVTFKETSGDEEVPRWLPSGDPRTDINGQTVPTIYEGKSRMNLFVNSLSSVSRLPIVDRTGLQALYGISFAIDLLLPPPPAGGGPRGGGGVNAGSPPPQQFDPPLPKAIEEQLGLHLERGKVPVEYLVVDHFEKLPEN